MKKRSVYVYTIVILIALCISVMLSLALGSKNIPIRDVLHHVLNASTDSFNGAIIQQRMIRTIFALLAGAALAVSGLLMQSLTRNPVADPSILGVNSGAALAVVAGITFFHISSAQQFIIFAIIGAAITTAFVYTIASVGREGATPMKLALAGAVSNGAIASLINMLVLPQAQSLTNFRHWQVGSVVGVSWDNILMLLPFLLLGFALAVYVAPSLNALALGDEMATGLGVKVKKIRFLTVLSSVILAGSITALAGPIAFVGLMVPHVLRLLFKNNIKVLIPLSIVTGAALLCVADTLGRLIAQPAEVEVGILTALIGAPVFIYVVIKSKVKSL
ncbi:iron complex transport system permease protein [Breznakia blatticola]|uniref:Iron complex transport system permease protein n=1 Tax=Breznakia blatticola TaxID=1754012 RepID=A0A4R7ZML9_9FIRM|nr:iron ABC transporter permease [Breznakia blatticola]TDW16460.1 iron complex transport system permease protein [Breznakia blatticola]